LDRTAYDCDVVEVDADSAVEKREFGSLGEQLPDFDRFASPPENPS
jgi:hypothetical protein